MEREPTNSDILLAIEQLSNKYASTDGRIDQLITTTDQRIDEVLEAIHVFSSSVDERFTGHDARFTSMDERFDRMDQRFDGMDQRFDRMDGRFDLMDQRFDRMDTRLDRMDERFDHVDERFDRIEATMVTKGDLIVLMRKEDRKLTALVGELRQRDVLDQTATHRILAMEPFSERN